MLSLGDTIAAAATGGGPAGLAVVRVSGPGALGVADAVFRGATALSAAPTHTLHHGWAVAPPTRAGPALARLEPSAGATLDEVVVAVFRAPRSYTREDVVEFSCHGGEWSARRLLASLLASGARLAGPGEFTLRAFLNGRLDLAQAEAVADVIHAATSRAHELALSQLKGELSARLEAIGERLADAVAEVEARVDFAEDVGGIEVPAHVVAAIEAVDRELAELLAASSFARAVREGLRVPLVGRPNVGKSSLFNALVGEDRAIVAAVPGTTRDRVSETIDLEGIRVTLSDTAGLRATPEPVEALGIARTERAIEEGAAVLWVVDGSAPLCDEDHSVAARLKGRRITIALNKRDRPGVVRVEEAQALAGGHAPVVAVSATRGEGVDELRATLACELGLESGERSLAVAVSTPRHIEALERAKEALGRGITAARAAAPGEIVALELGEALRAIGEVTGRAASEDLLERIFSRFCIGK